VFEVGEAEDPEALYYVARTTLFTGDARGGLELMARVVDGGYFCNRLLRHDPWLAPVRDDPAFASLLARADDRAVRAAQLFRDAGGEALLGVRLE
jgi:hypothetical protein